MRRAVTGLALLLAVAYLLAVGWAYRHPPLSIGPAAAYSLPSGPVLGLDLANLGRFPIYLSEVRVDGAARSDATVIVSLAQPGATAVYLASAVAAYPEEQPHRSGPVRGAKVPFTRFGEVRDNYGVKLTFPPDSPRPETVEIRYRYLGWPFRLTYNNPPWP